jgi:DNA repair exonuclease SbcCD ATPase subunit
MKLLIKKISLEWFKGITTLDINFVDTTTIIKGRNGAGKSTIADALSWLLFGKNAKGETTFGIKTRDSQGNDIPHKDHTVTAVFLVDGKEVTLSRTLK